MQDWEILEEDADTVYLSFEEIEAIRTCDLGTHAHLSDYRDELVLGCLTGLRFSDFSNIEENRVSYLFVQLLADVTYIQSLNQVATKQ
jgi:hypothetical protein